MPTGLGEEDLLDLLIGLEQRLRLDAVVESVSSRSAMAT